MAMSFTDFEELDTANFGPAPIREAWGSVLVDEEGHPVIKSDGNRYFCWITNIYNGHSFPWGMSKQEARAVSELVIGEDGLRFRVFEHGTYINKDKKELPSTCQEISNLSTGEIIWKLPKDLLEG